MEVNGGGGARVRLYQGNDTTHLAKLIVLLQASAIVSKNAHSSSQ